MRHLLRPIGSLVLAYGTLTAGAEGAPALHGTWVARNLTRPTYLCLSFETDGRFTLITLDDDRPSRQTGTYRSDAEGTLAMQMDGFSEAETATITVDGADLLLEFDGGARNASHPPFTIYLTRRLWCDANAHLP